MLHPARQVDVILNMDASSDVQLDSFPQRVGQIGFRRGLDFQRRERKAAVFPPPESEPIPQYVPSLSEPQAIPTLDPFAVTNPPAPAVDREVTMVYLPLLPNEEAVPGYDPSTTLFSGSYNLVWTPKQIDMILKVSEANWGRAEKTVKEALFKAWQRKKWNRENGGVGGEILMGEGACAGVDQGSQPNAGGEAGLA